MNFYFKCSANGYSVHIFDSRSVRTENNSGRVSPRLFKETTSEGPIGCVSHSVNDTEGPS
jgi:hypothetical protein